MRVAGGNAMNHFDEMTGLLYLEQQLDAPHAQEVRTHVANLWRMP